MAVYTDPYGFPSKYGPSRNAPRAAYSVDPFVADPLGYSRVLLTWGEPSGFWDGFRIIRSRSGWAVNERDGAKVYDQTDTTELLVTNLIPGASFEDNISAWEAAGTATLTHDTAVALAGSSSLKVATSGAGNGVRLKTIATVSDGPWSVSVWVKGTGAVSVSLIRDPGATTVETTVGEYILTTQWQRITVTGSYAPGTEGVSVLINQAASGSNHFWVDEATLTNTSAPYDFNGNTSNGDYDTYSWVNGEDNVSESTAYFTFSVSTNKSVTDTGLEGGWYYYTAYIHNLTTNEWELAGKTSTLVPFDYGSSEKLWSYLPEWYKYVRDDAAGVNEQLFKSNPRIYLSNDNVDENSTFFAFITLFGWGMDILRTQIDMISDSYRPLRVHIGRLSLLAGQFGTTLEAATPDSNNRSLVRNLARLYQIRGTLNGIGELLALTSGWWLSVFIGPNRMLDLDQATFASPGIPTWDPQVRYITGDTVRRNNFYFQAIQTAYGDAQGPPLAKVANSYWSPDPFAQTKILSDTNRADTGDVSTWQTATPVTPGDPLGSWLYRSGWTKIGLGITHPTEDTGVTGALVFKNNTTTAKDILVRSIPRLASDLASDDRAQVVRSGIPIPQVHQAWEEGTYYYRGDRVVHEGTAWEALSATDAVPGDTSWTRIGYDERVRMAASFYTHGPYWDVGSVLVKPYLAFFNDSGDLITETVPDTDALSAQILDTFRTPGSVTTGRTADNGKTWSNQGSGAWIQESNPLGGFAYPSVSGRTYQVADLRADGALGLTFRKVGNRELGIIFRLNGSNFWLATNRGLYKVTGGTKVLVGDNYSCESGDRLTVNLKGSSITVKINGVTVASVTDTFNMNATYHGIDAEAA